MGKEMKIWITGIAGFLGSHLANELLALGHEVWGNDNLICGDVSNVGTEKTPAGFDRRCFETIDCCDQSEMFKGLTGGYKSFNPDVLIHCAATPAEGFSVFSPNFITKNIAEASVATFSAAIAAGVKRIVFLSSMARYGKGNPPFKEEDIVNPVDPYGLSKVYAEQQLKMLCDFHGVKWSIICPHNIIGRNQQITPYRNVVTIFLNRLKLGMPVYIYGDGEQKRSFSPVADCIQSLVKVINGDGDGEIINIGPDGNEITINNLLEMCEMVTGISAERIYLPPRPLTDSVVEAYCSSDKARKLLGYRPEQSLFDCIKDMSDNIIPKPFSYDFPIEISHGCPKTWMEKL